MRWMRQRIRKAYGIRSKLPDRMVIEGQDNIQKWLERCLWRNVPGDVGVDIIFLN